MKLLLIGHPPGYEEERFYIFNIIFGEFLGIPYQSREIPNGAVTIQLAGALDEGIIQWPDILFQKSSREWFAPSSLPSSPLRIWAVKKDLPDARVVRSALPIIYGEPIQSGQWFEHDGHEIRIGLDIAGSAFFMLTRYEEFVLSDRDEHNRFPAKASLAYKEDFLERPIIDEYVEILWACMKRLWPGLECKKRTYRIRLSHDVDEPLGCVGKPWPTVLKNMAGDLIKRRSAELAVQRFMTRIGGDSEKDPYNTFGFIMDISERYGLKSTFFFKSGLSHPLFDNHYSLNDLWIQRLMQTIHKRGHEIGLHPSYESYNRYEIMQAEYDKLLHTAEQLGIFQEKWPSRQHYLRWENPTTWQILEDVGLAYDTTLGFADWIGFRCGTCREFPVFNLKTRQSLCLKERSLIVMDTTLLATKYMGLQPEQVLEQIVRLGNICRLYGGDLNLLWHNTNLVEKSQQALYSRVIRELVEAAC